MSAGDTYVVPDAVGTSQRSGSAEVRKNLMVYVETYGMTQEQQDRDFLILPDSRFATFVTPISIYDPGKPSMRTFLGPPYARGPQPDVIAFGLHLSQEYAKRFSEVWREHKKSPP